MASSMVPTSARMKVKKRVINLVNPADPQEFSVQSISPTTSPNASNTAEDQENTPPQPSESTQTYSYTPLEGVKGILRPTGTPGSGNGVRFFPKNRFRVITPNQSLLPTPKPPPSPSNSFFSQLLAVTIPSMSPRRGPVQEEVKDDSWERPGEEGEVSMVASTASGDRTAEISQIDEEMEREDSWNGQPEVHCSPLALPTAPDGNTSKDASFNGLELPSADLQLPEDMSNLLSTNFTTDDPSYSMADPPSTLFPPRDLHPSTLSPIREMSNASEADFWGAPATAEASMQSEMSEHDESNPTIRRQLSPLSAPPLAHPSTPTPVPRPFHATSIFADMSAEQAELTWPLVRPNVDLKTDSTFASPLQQRAPSTLATPRAGGAGDVTEFFDCSTMTLSPPDSSVVLRASSNHTQGLIVPTKALFEAQAAHTSALTTELDLYKSLTRKLQNEVSERDDVLGKLNIRALEAEVLHSQVQDLREELEAIKSTRGTSLSLSPTPAQQRRNMDLPSDRTMAAQSEAKELEVRFAKALADTQLMARQLSEAQQSEAEAKLERDTAQSKLTIIEDEERDRLVQAQGREDELIKVRAGLEDAHRQLDLLEKRENEAIHHAKDLIDLREELEEARRHIADLELNADDVHAFRAELDIVHQQADQLEAKEEEVQAIRVELKEAHQQLDEHDARLGDVQAIRAELDEAHRQLDAHDTQAEEIQALRAELDRAHQQLDECDAQDEDVQAIREELEEARLQLSERDAGVEQQVLEKANNRITELKQHVADLTQVKLADEEEIDKLLGEVDRLKGARKREDEWRGRVAELERRVEIEVHMRQEAEKALNGEKQARKDAELDNEELKAQLRSISDELTQSRTTPKEDTSLRSDVARLRSESASKDLEIMNLQRRKAELKEDREMLNIALDSKQQELELMKRKFAVKGIAGNTPLAPSRKVNNNNDNDITSSVVSTPLPGHSKIMGMGVTTGMTTRNRRRSSLALLTSTQTPLSLPSVPKTLLQTPAPRGHAHGVQLYPSTKISSRVMTKVNEENVPPMSVVGGAGAGAGSIRRRERMLA